MIIQKKLHRLTKNIFYPFCENKQNKLIEKQYKEPQYPIYAFYHIYADNNWRDIVQEQVNNLIDSGLYTIIKKIYVSLICTSDDDYKFAARKLGEKAEFIHISTNPKEYEFPALEYLKTKAENEEFYSLYFHTKGSGNSNKTLKWYKPAVNSLKELIEISSAWRQFMAYWNFYRYRLAISVLQDNKWGGVYGANYQIVENNKHFYAGNFWWATSAFIRTRAQFSTIDKSWRFNAETWLLENRWENIYDAYRMSVNLVAVKFPIKILTGTKFQREIAKITLYRRHLIFSLKKVLRRLLSSNK